MDPRAILLDELVKHAYLWRSREEDYFTLASGKRSAEYFDCKPALSQPAAMAALGRLLLHVLDKNVTAIGGLTMGADPIAISASQASANTAHLVRWFSVRKEPKVHGLRKRVEGDVRRGERVAIVDDVVTTGKSTVDAIEACVSELDLKIAQVIVLVDREESRGIENLREKAAKAAGAPIPVMALFTKTEIVNEWRRRNQQLVTSAETKSTHFAHASAHD